MHYFFRRLICGSAALACAAFLSAADLPSDQPVGNLEIVAELWGPIVTGITVSKTGRIFVSYPRWSDPVTFTVAELINGKPVPYPSQAINDQTLPADQRLISVQSVVVDARDRLWMLDSGSYNQGEIIPGGPKLVAVDLSSGQIVQKIVFASPVVKPLSYLNDVRFNLRMGAAGFAFITDSSTESGNGIIVVDLATGQSVRRLEGDSSVRPEPDFLPVVEGQPLMVRPPDAPPKRFLTGSDSIAISPDGSELFYAPLSSRSLYSVSTALLADFSKTDAEISAAVIDHGDKGTGSDGIEMDDRGRLFLTSYEHDAILVRTPEGDFQTLVHDPRLLWPDTLSISRDGYLYMTVNQLHRQARFHYGQDLRQKPWVIFRTKIDAGPVLLDR